MSRYGRGDDAPSLVTTCRRHAEPVPGLPAGYAVGVTRLEAELVLPGGVGLAVGVGPPGAWARLVLPSPFLDEALPHGSDDRAASVFAEERRSRELSPPQ